MKFNIKFLLVFCLVILLAGCTKDYDKLNVNPNGLSVAPPERLLNPALYAVVSTNINASYNLNNELAQTFVARGEVTEVHRYIIRAASSDAMWNSWYLEKTNFQDMYNIAKPTSSLANSQGKTYMAIANVLDAWATSLLTDTYGDVPYLEANQGKSNTNYTPKFDAQKDVYQEIFRKLEEANTLFSANQYLTVTQQGLDALFGSSATNIIELARWRKFGNSLYLRLLLRVSARNEAIAGGQSAAQKISRMVADPATYPIFASNEESAILRLTGDTFPLRSPFTGLRTVAFNGNGSYSQFFINTLKDWGDPRLALWATKVDNDYKGIQSGYLSGQIPAPGSTYNTPLMLEPLLGNIMNYAELQFVLAEAALKGYIPGSAKTYYDLGVRAAIEHWGLVMPTGYLSSTAIAWNDADSFDQKMEQIIAQKYFTLFFTDFQQWIEYRRTGHPVLTIGPGASNGGILPTRLTYPVFTQSLNGNNYKNAVASMGADDMKTRMWWDIN